MVHICNPALLGWGLEAEAGESWNLLGLLAGGMQDKRNEEKDPTTALLKERTYSWKLSSDFYVHCGWTMHMYSHIYNFSLSIYTPTHNNSK